MKRLRILLITIAVSMGPMFFVILKQETQLPALQWISNVLIIALSVALFVMLLTFAGDLKDITPKDWDKYEEE